MRVRKHHGLVTQPGIDFDVYRGSKDSTIIESKTHQDPLGGDQVLLKIRPRGLCGTDEHYRSADQVLGHEGAGIVQELGPEVCHLKKKNSHIVPIAFTTTNQNCVIRGDRVGFGYLHDSCGRCEQCLTGRETFCAERVMYGMGDFDIGSFASHAIWREAYLLKFPDSIPNEYAVAV
jgi:D-arabinose 1-dehydrogenase-like Zn-dependent alcohol dehydrogenase